jgi:hypothetical protein
MKLIARVEELILRFERRKKRVKVQRAMKRKRSRERVEEVRKL